MIPPLFLNLLPMSTPLMTSTPRVPWGRHKPTIPSVKLALCLLFSHLSYVTLTFCKHAIGHSGGYKAFSWSHFTSPIFSMCQFLICRFTQYCHGYKGTSYQTILRAMSVMHRSLKRPQEAHNIKRKATRSHALSHHITLLCGLLAFVGLSVSGLHSLPCLLAPCSWLLFYWLLFVCSNSQFS